MTDEQIQNIRFEQTIKAAAWDELKIMIPSLTLEVKDLRRTLRFRPWVMAGLILAGAAIVMTMFVLYFQLISDPRFNELDERLERLEQADATTTTTVPSQSRTEINVRPGGTGSSSSSTGSTPMTTGTTDRPDNTTTTSPSLTCNETIRLNC